LLSEFDFLLEQESAKDTLWGPDSEDSDQSNDSEDGDGDGDGFLARVIEEVGDNEGSESSDTDSDSEFAGDEEDLRLILDQTGGRELNEEGLQDMMRFYNIMRTMSRREVDPVMEPLSAEEVVESSDEELERAFQEAGTNASEADRGRKRSRSESDC
jgi:hypothetical protein